MNATMLLILSSSLTQIESKPSFDSYLAPYDKANLLSGTVLVAKGKKVIFEKSYGFAVPEFGIKNSPTLPSCIASVTKPLTMGLIVKFIYEGKLSADAKLEQFIPGFENGKNITIVDLLGHRAGIPHRVTTDGQETQFMSAEKMAQLASKCPPLAKPGERSIYSSATYSVLARIAEKIEKLPFHKILSQIIFEPAGAKSTFDLCQMQSTPKHAKGMIITPDGWIDAQPKNLSFLVGAGSVCSTARDLFSIFRYGGLEGKLGPAVKANWIREGRTYWNGITSGYRSFLTYDETSEVTIVFCGNTTTAAADRIRNDFPLLAAGKKIKVRPIPKPTAYEPSPTELDEFVGEFKSVNGTDRITISKWQQLLLVGDSILIPTAKDVFFSNRDFGTISAIREAGKPLTLDWRPETGGSWLIEKVSSEL